MRKKCKNAVAKGERPPTKSKFTYDIISNFFYLPKSEIKVAHIILGVRRSRLRLSDAEKMDIIERFENGERKSHIARDLGMNKSTIGAIIKRRAEKI